MKWWMANAKIANGIIILLVGLLGNLFGYPAVPENTEHEQILGCSTSIHACMSHSCAILLMLIESAAPREWLFEVQR
uniref:Putative secreted peptide n=1 Tax=Anopheles braziliensis TaxID=58242 RepID=A0A2M3ZXG6_9DIPT